ncbi:hypothetical protein FOG50_04110 [Hanseniaspora uvarum]|nr:hypothetical protein FOG50_04110 [Hanseniaspora uvarum]
MLRKQLMQSLNKRSFSLINKQNAIKTASLSLKMKSIQPKLNAKSSYSSNHHDNGARFDDKLLNVSVEDVFAYGLSAAAVYYIIDSVFGEKKEEVEPVEEEVKEAEPVKEEVEDSTSVVEEEKTSAETPIVEEIAKKNDEDQAVNDTLALQEETAVEDTKVLEEENLVNEQSAQEEATSAAEETIEKEATPAAEETIEKEATPAAEEATEKESESVSEENSTEKEATPAAEENSTEAGAVDPSAGPAYNPETGEINWDCPCLGGMAHGPCGEEFKTAFSCFIYSEAEPKGVDCVEKFQGMQECFKKHPEVYAEQLKDDDEVEHVHPVEEQSTETSAAEPETFVEEILVGDVPAAVIEEVVPIVNEAVEEITPVVEEKVEEIVAKTENNSSIPEVAEDIIEEGLPVNADD